ncbi:TRAP transporter small permease [Pirellulales bacterium]|nr:TRAP transporter small permease [Pirellulales bacterium]
MTASFYRILDRVLETLLFIILAAMVALVSAGVVWRYLLRSPISWADELASILMVWFTFLGAALGMRDRAHYAFDYLVTALPPRAKRLVGLLGQLVAIGISGALLYWSAQISILFREWTTPALEISRALVYSACPVGACFILLYAVRDLVLHLKGEPPESTP